jgi:uncharacterized membrane protein YfcA
MTRVDLASAVTTPIAIAIITVVAYLRAKHGQQRRMLLSVIVASLMYGVAEIFLAELPQRALLIRPICWLLSIIVIVQFLRSVFGRDAAKPSGSAP